MAKHNAFIALGSNLNEPSRQVLRAFQAIENLPGTRIIKRSSLYLTPPVGYDNQPDFINAVTQVETELAPEILMQALLKIEQEAGRERPFANAPRVLDLDLLLYDDITMHTALLTLPHPRMHQRAFVLMPLAEISPDFSLANHGNIVKLLQSMDTANIRKL